MDKKSSKLKIGSYILYGILTVLILVLILSMNDIGEIFETVKSANFSYILLGMLCILLHMALYPLSLCVLTKARGCKISFGVTYNIAMTEHFFNGITPFATGGQPFQAYAYSRAGVKVSESTCLLLMNFMVHMLVTNGFALLSLIYFKHFVVDLAMTIIAIVGFTMNFAVLIFTFLLATSKRARGILCKILDLLCKIKFLNKFLAPKAEGVKEYFKQVQEAFSHLMKKKGAFLLAIFTKILSMAAYYTTTYFILLALGVNVTPNDLFFIICGTSFAITMVVFLPTPGSSGGIEFAFRTVFASLAMGAAVTVSYGGMLIWRLMSYYVVMLLSLFCYIGLEIYFSRRAKAKAEIATEGYDGEDLQPTEGYESSDTTPDLSDSSDIKSDAASQKLNSPEEDVK